MSVPSADDHVTDEGDTIVLPRGVWERLLGHYPGSGAMLADIRNDATGIERVVCLGMPHTDEGDEEDGVVYVPQWILENIGCELDGGAVIVEPHLEEIPLAVAVTLRPMDTAIYHTDIRDAFEAGLDKYHVLQQGSMLTVAIDVLGGYKVGAYIEKTEPAGVVRLGGEVRVEFLEPEGGVEEFVSARGAAAAAAAVAAVAPEPTAAAPPEPAPTKTKEEIRLARLAYFTKSQSGDQSQSQGQSLN